jgi:DNA gyrase/topoisomerase IV subunit B
MSINARKYARKARTATKVRMNAPYNKISGRGGYKLQRAKSYLINNYRKPYRYPGVGATVGRYIGQTLGGPAGGQIGQVLGQGAHALTKTITGFGEEAPAEEEETEEVAVKGKNKQKISIQRYKGLGEMNADELGETTMDINKRILQQVTIADAQDADKVFDILMGEDVFSRKSFIQSNAKAANLDI